MGLFDGLQDMIGNVAGDALGGVGEQAQNVVEQGQGAIEDAQQQLEDITNIFG